MSDYLKEIQQLAINFADQCYVFDSGQLFNVGFFD